MLKNMLTVCKPQIWVYVSSVNVTAGIPLYKDYLFTQKFYMGFQ
jgi:hypothetical protein